MYKGYGEKAVKYNEPKEAQLIYNLSEYSIIAKKIKWNEYKIIHG